MISGSTTLIAHIGYPTETFKAPLIYNPYFEKARIDAVVVPMGPVTALYRRPAAGCPPIGEQHGLRLSQPHAVRRPVLDPKAVAEKGAARSTNAARSKATTARR